MWLSVVKAIKKLIEAMQENSLSVGVISLTELITTKLSAASGSHLEIEGATGKDIKFKLTDAAGARKVYILDSADATVVSIDSDGTVTGVSFVGALTGNVTGNVTAGAAADLELNSVAAKDIIVTLGDNAGAQKVSFADSDDSEVGSLDSEGNLDLDGVVTPAGGIVHIVDTGEYTIPDNSECIAAFGAADAVGAGFMGVIIDTGNSKTYLAVSNGSAYQIFEGVAAAT